MNTADPVTIISVRNLHRQIANCVLFEFEDLITDFHQTQLVSPQSERRVQRKVFRTVKRFSDSNSLAHKLSAYPATYKISERCQLIVAVVDNPYQLHLLNSLKGWRNHPAKKACYLSELWPGHLKDPSVLREPFKDYDHVFGGLSHTVQQLEENFGVSCSYLPLGVDADLFATQALKASRCIDMAYLGRRESTIHEELKKLGEQENYFYLFDTLSELTTPDHVSHRQMFSSLLARSKFSFAFPAKKNLGGYTENVHEIGVRYYEFAAAGTIILGEIPANEHFEKFFGWDKSVIEITQKNVASTVKELMREPAEMQRISLANIKNSLLRHDWAYRWSDILSHFSMEPDPRLNQRIQALTAMAASISSD